MLSEQRTFALMTKGPSNFSFSGILKITRFPNLLIIALSQYLVAIFLVLPEPDLSFIGDLNLHLLVFSTMMIAAAGYMINDYYDVKIDLINKPNRVIVGKVIKRRVIMVMHSSFNMIAVLVGIYVGPWVAAIHVLSSFILWLYSNQLKRLPFIGNFSVSLMTGLSILIVAVYFKAYEPLLFVYAFFAFALTLIREIIKDLEDWRGDATHGCLTLPIVWGLRKTKNLLYLIIGLFILSIFYFTYHIHNIVLTSYFAVLAIPFLYFTYRLMKADSIKQFSFLSAYCKMMMLSGVLSMSFF